MTIHVTRDGSLITQIDVTLSPTLDAFLKAVTVLLQRAIEDKR